ncbi:MAG: hypothetical protein MJZ37_00835 [Bacilli bacterium]|nr:hypothetical protein [Bacilli bacterium]
MKVFFENNKWAELTQDQLDLHIKMQKVYNDIGKEREDFVEKQRERSMKSCYNPDLFQKEQEEYRAFLKQLEPRLDFCFKYDQCSMLPPLSVKIKEIKQ